LRKTILAGVLIAVGILLLAYQTITYKTRETAIDLGPLQVTTEKTRTLPLPPIVGGIVLLSGLALLVLGRSHPTEAIIVGRK
jgi:hypothetical protein